MWSTLRRGAGIACFRLAYTPIQNRKLDVDAISSPTKRDPDSGVDRVLKIFDRDENGTISPEASFITMYGFVAGVIGAAYGGLYQSRSANFNYRESNEATLYFSNKVAARKLLDATTIGFSKGVVRWGLRYAIFSTTFIGLSTIISRYRGEFGILEYPIAGLVAGTLYRLPVGPKPMISGGFFGGVLGFIAGITIYGAMKLSGVTMQEVYEACQIYYKMKDFYFHDTHKNTEEPDIVRDNFASGGMESIDNSLKTLDDIKDISELKYSKINNESSVNKNIEKK